MKSMRMLLGAVLVVVMVGVVNFCFAAEKPAAPKLEFAKGEIVKIMGVEGTVLVKISPSAEWAPAQIGQALQQNDSIKTDENSWVTLEFVDTSSISLKKKAELTISELSWEKDLARKVRVDMNSGELRAIIKKFNGTSEFKVKTPTGTCGARGTIFYIVISPADLSTRVFVDEGTVVFSNIAGQQFEIPQGMSSITSSDGTVSVPVELTPEQADQIRAAGWDVVAEPYTPPAGAPPGGAPPGGGDAPGPIHENTASPT